MCIRCESAAATDICGSDNRGDYGYCAPCAAVIDDQDRRGLLAGLVDVHGHSFIDGIGD
jgi:hypothetical protein